MTPAALFTCLAPLPAAVTEAGVLCGGADADEADEAEARLFSMKDNINNKAL